MKTLIPLNLEILTDYSDWKNANQNWNIGDYLNLNFDINAALAFSKLYFPDFIEIEGCTILNFRYNEEIFWKWYKYFDGDIKNTEFKCNFFEVRDYFTNRVEYKSDEEFEEVIDTFSEILKISWETNLKVLFPMKKFVVDVFEEFDTKRITLFSEL